MTPSAGVRSPRTTVRRHCTNLELSWKSAALWLTIALMQTAPGGVAVAAGAESDPVEPKAAVRTFYESLANGDCEVAQRLRPDYSVDRCKDIADVDLSTVEPVYRDGRVAVVFVTVNYRKRSDAEAGLQQFSGHLTLGLRDGHWEIDGQSIRSGSRADGADYLRKVANVVPVNSPGLPAPTSAAATAQSPPVESPVPAPRATSPSSPLLDALWPAEQLAGKPGDPTIVRLKSPDRRPPDRLEPEHRLPVLPAERFGSIRGVAPRNGEKLVALTFDLCERADDVTGYDRDIVNTLREKRVSATLFAGGKWLRSHPEKALQLMADPLFEIGNHAWTHGNFRMIDEKIADEQIAWTQAQYEILLEELRAKAARSGIGGDDVDNIPPAPRVFRFPYGTCNPDALARVAAHGLAAIQWDVVSGDPDKSVSAAALTRTILRGVRPGSIVVFHGNGRGWKTAAALPKIVEDLRAKGFRFVTVSELLDSGTPITTDTCYELKPGDNARYDRMFGAGTQRR